MQSNIIEFVLAWQRDRKAKEVSDQAWTLISGVLALIDGKVDPEAFEEIRDDLSQISYRIEDEVRTR